MQFRILPVRQNSVFGTACHTMCECSDIGQPCLIYRQILSQKYHR